MDKKDGYSTRHSFKHCADRKDKKCLFVLVVQFSVNAAACMVPTWLVGEV